ncbi:hypothetical protein HC028_26305 [Planosporangium flavigriseum]|uniref:Uncharacterized protein n=1 Tax=Planosporangium flavigriseum TaxID=373681 RepID=A0A8J3LRA8_9ACTN|nr:hypothetical protein [Planosporangium flavigriseum]NJC67992.1 hypothetical protein [Planosporangium flavigriseum]GIG76597.1 hypothetical protein Pfl04_50010 [Planosporangium flavigriseum]
MIVHNLQAQPGQCESWPLAWGVVYPVLLVIAAVGAVGGLWAVRQVARLALVLAGAMILLAYATSEPAGVVPTTSVRYLSPLMVCVPVVLWPLWSAVSRRTIVAGA